MYLLAFDVLFINMTKTLAKRNVSVKLAETFADRLCVR